MVATVNTTKYTIENDLTKKKKEKKKTNKHNMLKTSQKVSPLEARKFVANAHTSQLIVCNILHVKRKQPNYAVVS